MSLGAVNGALTLPVPLPPPLASVMQVLPCLVPAILFRLPKLSHLWLRVRLAAAMSAFEDACRTASCLLAFCLLTELYCLAYARRVSERQLPGLLCRMGF